MFKILKESSYVFITINNVEDFNVGHASSGSLQLAFNSLCKLILPCNHVHNFTECIEYSDEQTDIILNDVDFDKISNEREHYITKFKNIVNYKMIYSNHFGRRKNTFEKSYDIIKNKESLVIVELGSSRSFVNGYISNDLKYWNPDHPEKWDWGAGVFTKVFAENLKGNKYTLYTIDPDNNANFVVSTMCKSYDQVIIKKEYSSVFLKQFSEKIDFLYMDHMETSEEAALQHLEDAKIIISLDLMNDGAIILIDDIGANLSYGKGKYSIPYFLENGYNLLIHEYQVLLIKA
jgi:hypothetical protein